MSDAITMAAVRQLTKEITGQANAITIPRVFIEWTDDLAAALLLSQIVYWSERTDDADGWFYKNDQEWEDELHMSRFQVQQAYKKLADRGVQKCNRRVTGRIGPQSHYRIDPDVFYTSFYKFLTERSANNLKNKKFVIQKTSKTVLQETSKTLLKGTSPTTSPTGEGATAAPSAPTPPTRKRAASSELAGLSATARDAVTHYRSIFGKYPNATQIREIAEHVTDLERWKAVCHDWTMNGWNPTAIGKMIARYSKPQPDAPAQRSEVIPLDFQKYGAALITIARTAGPGSPVFDLVQRVKKQDYMTPDQYRTLREQGLPA